MKTIQPAPLLKIALIADAAACAPLALLQVAMPDLLAGQLAMPRALLTGTGIFLLAYTLLLIVLANSKNIWKGLIDLIIVGNVGWAVGCVALLAAAPFTPSGLGIGYLALQALAVLALAGAEFAGLKASSVKTGSDADRAGLVRGR